MSTMYDVHTPSADFSNKSDKGGDSNVRYAGGKRQKVRGGVEYFRGKLPQGEFHGRVVKKSPTAHTGK